MSNKCVDAAPAVAVRADNLDLILERKLQFTVEKVVSVTETLPFFATLQTPI